MAYPSAYQVKPFLQKSSRAAAKQTHDKAYTQRKTLLVKKFVCLRQGRSRILRGRSRAERPQDSPEDRGGMDTDRQQDRWGMNG